MTDYIPGLREEGASDVTHFPGNRSLTDQPVRFCRGCGRQMVPGQQRGSYDSKTGERQYDTILVCPRFNRSWRNLWFGGWFHYGVQLSDRSGMPSFSMELRWH